MANSRGGYNNNRCAVGCVDDGRGGDVKEPNECKCGTRVQTGRRANAHKAIPENHSIYCDNCVRSITTESLELTIKIWNKMNPIDLDNKIDAITEMRQYEIQNRTR